MWDSHVYEIKFVILLLICLMLIWLLDQLKEALKGREKFSLTPEIKTSIENKHAQILKWDMEYSLEPKWITKK